MKYLAILLLAASVSSSALGAGKTVSSKSLVRRLKQYSTAKTVNDSIVLICSGIVDTLVERERADEMVYVNACFDLTEIYGTICERANTALSVHSFLRYLLAKQESAEEQLSVSLERIFARNPELVLREIKRCQCADRMYLLARLAEGIGSDPKTPDVACNETAVMNRYPALRQIYKQYQEMIDYLVKNSYYANHG